MKQGRDRLAAQAGVIDWALGRLGLPAAHGLPEVLASWPADTWLVELSHDERLGFALVAAAPEQIRLSYEAGSRRFRPGGGRNRVTAPDSWRASGDLHGLLRSTPAGGHRRWELVLPVVSESDLCQGLADLGALGLPAGILTRLPGAGALVTDPTSLQLALEVDGDRVVRGVDLLSRLDPVFEFDPALASLGVPPDHVQAMLAALAALAPATGPAGPAGGADNDSYRLAFDHLRVALTVSGSALRTVLRMAPAPGPGQLRPQEVARASQPWPTRLAWARACPPLRAPTPDDFARLSRWEQAVDPNGVGRFETRLARDGLSREQALVAVSSQPGPPADPPPWYEVLVAGGAADHRGLDDLAWLELAEGHLPRHVGRHIPFAHLWWPVVETVWQRFAGHPGLTPALSSDAASDLRIGLLNRLSEVSSACLMEFLWAGTTFGERMLAQLGPAPQSQRRHRYATLCRGLARDGVGRVLDAHPGLGGVLSQAISGWWDSTEELLTRIDQDRALIEASFGIPAQAPIAGIRIGAGDSHDGGRTVCLVRLGTDTVVYKPRSLDLEATYAELVSALAQRDPDQAIRAPRVLCRADAGGSYGYAEHIAARACQDPGELARFYANAGRTLAVLYALAATDCHHENLIAVGDQLVLVDAETLLHPPSAEAGPLPVAAGIGATDGKGEADGDGRDGGDGGRDSGAEAGGAEAGVEAFGAGPSVLDPGLLPRWLWLAGRRTAADFSALGVAPGPVAPQEWRRGTGWRAINTDAMVPGTQRVDPQPSQEPIPQPDQRGDPDPGPPAAPEPGPPRGPLLPFHPTSLPTPPGVPGSLPAHLEGFVAGFTGAYRQLAAGAGSWLGELVARAAARRRRIVTRSTYVYATLLESSLAPAALTGTVTRGLVLERLSRSHLGAGREATWPLLAAEQEALWRLDIPMFSGPVRGGHTRWFGGGLAGWPHEMPAQQVRGNLDRLGESDLAVQVALIRASVAASQLALPTRGTAAGPRSGAADPPASAAPAQAPGLGARCLAEVGAAGIGPAGKRTWLGLGMLPDWVHANAANLGPNLYDGQLGLAIALLEARRSGLAAGVRPDPRDRDLTGGEPAGVPAGTAALLTLQSLLTTTEGRVRPGLVTSMGLGYAGVGGLLRGVAFLADRGHMPPARAAALQAELVGLLTPQLLARDPHVDLIAGVAGLVAPLVRLRDQPGVPELIAAAGDALALAQDGRTGGWVTPISDTPLTGLAHGASGMALALAEAALALQDDRFLVAAHRGLTYEADTFDAEVGNWPDLRAGFGPGAFMMGWCAGAPGIALARMRLLELMPDAAAAAQWRHELDLAARATAMAPLQAKDHLCCGNLGRSAILEVLGESCRNQEWSAQAAGIRARVSARAGAGLPRPMLGAPGPPVLLPALMTGQAGMGMALIGLPARDWVPQLLL